MPNMEVRPPRVFSLLFCALHNYWVTPKQLLQVSLKFPFMKSTVEPG